MNGTKQTTWFAHIIHMYHRICGIIPYSYVWCLGDITRSWCWCHRSPPVQQPRGVWGRSISARVMRWGMLKYPYIWRLTNSGLCPDTAYQTKERQAKNMRIDSCNTKNLKARWRIINWTINIGGRPHHLMFILHSSSGKNNSRRVVCKAAEDNQESP
jgi:hypothetical protein